MSKTLIQTKQIKNSKIYILKKDQRHVEGGENTIWFVNGSSLIVYVFLLIYKPLLNKKKSLKTINKFQSIIIEICQQ